MDDDFIDGVCKAAAVLVAVAVFVLLLPK